MRLSHDDTGDGPAVLLLHSTVADRRMWNPQLPALVAAGFRAVRCDLSGFGDTPAPTGPYDDARDVIDLLDHLGIERVALVGSSGGGQVALEVAARRPERVTALALLCTALPGREPSEARRAFAEREDALLAAGDIDAATELNVRTFLGPRADAATRMHLREMQRHTFEVQLAVVEEFPALPSGYDVAAITAPTLLVSGAHDLPDFTEIAAELAGRLPRARHVALDWAGHLPSLERPDVINALLLDFLVETG
jgi:3-oxoadipate enol-lactonase